MKPQQSNVDSKPLLDQNDQSNQIAWNEPQSPRTISFTKYYSFLKRFDYFLLIGGTLAAVSAGGILPSISLVMGHVASAFTNSGSSPTNIKETMSFIAVFVMLIALLLFIFSYIFYAFYQHLAENICKDLR